jgi:vacuolar protein sorting-associated protein 26
MELHVVKKETVGSGPTPNVETTTMTKYEIMDGGPFKSKDICVKLDETIPIRFFLAPYPLTPSYNNINKRFSVQYFISLVLTDAEERKYFKQHEITLIRVDKIDEKF